MGRPDVSVCIVTWNNAEVIGQLLASLPGAVGGAAYEVLVTDNDSGDGTADLLVERHPEVRLERNATNRYFTFATNQNLRRAAGRYVASINPDGVMGAGSVARMIDVLEADPGVGAVTPRFVRPDGSDRVSFAQFMTPRWGLYEAVGLNEAFPNNRVNRAVLPTTLTYDPLVARDVEVLYGACLVMRREVLDAVGLNDEALVHGFDEYDFCRRVRRAGWRLRYEPTATMMHIEGVSRAQVSDSVRAELDWYHRDAVAHLCRTHFGFWFGLLYQSLFVTVRPVVLLAARWSRRLRGLAGRLYRSA